MYSMAHPIGHQNVMGDECSVFHRTTRGKGCRTAGRLSGEISRRSGRRLLQLLNISHDGGSGMVLFGSAQHQRLIEPRRKREHCDRVEK